VVLFTQKALPLTTDLFSPFAGETAEQQEDRPKEGIRRQSGPLDGAELRTGLSPILAEFFLGPPPLTADKMLGEFPHTTGELKAELAKFERRLLQWLPKWEAPTMRVSLVVQARASAVSPINAYEILRDNLTSVAVNPGEMGDFMFRVNWKAKTDSLAEGYLNRLSTWTAVQFRVLAGSAGGPQVQIATRDFAQVEMDLNTPADRKEPLPRDQLGPIFGELFQLAVEIADHGEHS
jgi:hypothetical protein